MSKPNLFNFATSELSQDAFLCWLIDWARHDSDKELQNCGREFILWMYSKRKSIRQEEPPILESVCKPKKQYKNTDVYFQARLSGKTVSFVIEDKTATSHHSNQLEEYLKRINGDDYKEVEVVGVYLKTGYWFPEDYLAESYSYIQVSGEDFLEFLRPYKKQIKNNILLDYFDELDGRIREIPKFKADCDPIRDFNHKSNNGASVIQCEFTIKLAKELMKVTSAPDSELVEAYHRVRRGTSIGGAPWTQLDVFRTSPAKFEGMLEAVFYRVDLRRNLPSICLRQWAPLNKLRGDRESLTKTKLGRLNDYKAVVEELRVKDKMFGLQFGGIRNDNIGSNESDIAIIFLESSADFTAILEKLPLFHKEFVGSCKDRGLVEYELTASQCKQLKKDALKEEACKKKSAKKNKSLKQQSR